MPALLCIFIWLALEIGQLISSPSSLLLILYLSTLPNLLPSPAFSLLSFLPNSSSFCCMPRCTNHSVCVHVSSLSLQADLLRRGGDKGAGNGGQNSSLVANEFLIRATNGAVPPMWLERSQSTGDRRPVTYTARVSWLSAGLRQTWVIIPLCDSVCCIHTCICLMWQVKGV